MSKNRVKRDPVVQPQDQSIRYIPLTQGKVAIVDASDYEWLSQWNWYAVKDRDNWYAQRREIIGQRWQGLYMHVALLGSLPGKEIDHIDADGLNNRSHNLRHVTHRQNSQRVRKSTGFKGVTWDKTAQRWLAQIKPDGKSIFLGRYNTPEEAAKAYDTAAIKHYREFARVNFPNHLTPQN